MKKKKSAKRREIADVSEAPQEIAFDFCLLAAAARTELDMSESRYTDLITQRRAE